MNSANAKFVCGAECGIAAVGTLSGGVEHWSSAAGTAATVVTSGPASMRSLRAFRFNTSAATSTISHTYATAVASPATVVVRCYIYFATLPSADTSIIVTNGTSTGNLRFVASDSTLRARIGLTNAASGITITTGQWYRIDLKSVHNATSTCDIQVDGVAGAQASVASSASTSTFVQFGPNAASTGDFYIDDIIVSGTSGEYPIGEGTVVGLYPDGDRTNTAAAGSDGTPAGTYHLYSATTDFGKGAGGATAVGAQNAESTSWQSLANPLSTSIGTNFVADLLGLSTEYMVWTLDDLPGDAGSVNGLMVVVATHSTSATANNQSASLRRSTGTGTLSLWSLLDLSEGTITVPVSVQGVDQDSNPWTPSAVNALLFRWGESSDVNPDPYLDGVCLEVDYVAVPAVPRASPYPQMIGR